jgi:tetratricopeptide (TPR) repeat protein
VFPLDDQIRIWKRKEGFLKESVWLDEGIKLYRDLLRKNPDSTNYKAELAKLLAKSGTDEKLVYMNQMNARDLFNEVLELYPNDTDALYRLGHLYYEIQDYEKSIEYFSKALHTSLSNIRRFRTYATMSKAFYKLGDDGEAIRCFEKARELDIENNFSSEIKELKALITQKGHVTRVIHYPDGATILETVDNVEIVKLEDDLEATLDMTHFHPSFTGPIDVARLQRKEAEVLRYLIEKRWFVTKEELIQYLWLEDEAPEPNSIKPIISKINRKLKTCLTDQTENPITSKRGHGYKWNSIETKIIKVL